MAVDKLVDSTKLNNSLEYTADRIRLKTGGSADILFDFENEKGFGDAIDAITTGGGSGAVLIEDTTDTAGGTVRTITALTVEGTKSITSNGTGIDVASYANVDVNVPGNTEFLITLTLTNNEWVPDKTFAQIQAAHTAGDIITLSAYNSSGGEYCQTKYFFSDEGTPTFMYNVVWFDYTDTGNLYDDAYSYTSTGLSLDARQTYSAPVTLVEKTITANGTYNPILTDYADGYSLVTVNVPSSSPNLQAKTNISPTTSSQTIQADSGYDGLSSVQINAMPSGSATTPTTTITANPSISISSSGLITSTVSGSQSVTPTVSAGYVTSGTSGTVSVSGSNTEQLTTQGATTVTPSTSQQTAVSAGTYVTGDVTVAAMPSGTAGTPTATKGTVSNHSISITPSVTNTTGYITGSTKTGTAVTVNVTELESGTKTITENGTGISVSGYSTVDVAVPTGSSKAIYTYLGLASRTANSYGSTSATVTVTKAGTYNISYVAVRGSSSGTMGTNLHIGSTSGTNNTTWNNGTYGQAVTLSNQTISADTAVTIYATSGNNSRTIYVGQLIVEEV